MLKLFTKQTAAKEAPKPSTEVTIQVDPKEALWLKEIESLEQELRLYVAKQLCVEEQERKLKESIEKIQAQHDALIDGAPKCFLAARLVAMRGEHANVNQQKQALDKALQPIVNKIADFEQAIAAIAQDDDPTKKLLQEQIAGLYKELESVKERMSDHTERKLQGKLSEVRKKVLKYRLSKFSQQKTDIFLQELGQIIDEFKKKLYDPTFIDDALRYLGPRVTDSGQFVKSKLTSLILQAEKTKSSALAQLEQNKILVLEKLFANTSELIEEQEVVTLVEDNLLGIFADVTYKFNLDLSTIMEDFKSSLLIKIAKFELTHKLDEATKNVQVLDQSLTTSLFAKKGPQTEYLEGVQKYYKSQAKLYAEILNLDLSKYDALCPLIDKYESILHKMYMLANSGYKNLINLKIDKNSETDENAIEILDLNITACELDIDINERKLRDLYDQMVFLSRPKVNEEARENSIGLLAYIPYNNNLIKVKDLLQSVFLKNTAQLIKEEPSITEILKENLNVLKLELYKVNIMDFISLLGEINDINIRLSKKDFYDSDGKYNAGLLYDLKIYLALCMSKTIIGAMHLHYEYCNLPEVFNTENEFLNNVRAYGAIIKEYEAFHEEVYCDDNDPQCEFIPNISLLCKVQNILKSLPSSPVRNFPEAINHLIKSNIEEMATIARANSPTSSWSSVRQVEHSIDEEASLSGLNEPPPPLPLFDEEESSVLDEEEADVPPTHIQTRPLLPPDLLKNLRLI